MDVNTVLVVITCVMAIISIPLGVLVTRDILTGRYKTFKLKGKHTDDSAT